MTLPALRDLIDQHFTAEELRQLCFDLSIEYENLPGNTRLAKAQALVAYCIRHNRLPELGEQCRQLRPDAPWPDAGAVAVELAEVQQTTDTLTGTLKNETLLAAMLAPLRQKEAELLTQLLGSGAVAQGAGSTALGERAIQAGQAQVIISGDNNSVQTLIHRYPQAPDPHELRRQIGHYLTWLLGWAGTLELYDLSGNVWEWCRNKFDNPDDDAVDDSGKRRVLRGGSWFSSQNRRARPAATSTIQSAVTAVADSGWWCVVPISIGHWPLLGLRAVAEQARAAGVDRHFFVA